MKWVTRERPKIDRIACPWLIARSVAQFDPGNVIRDRSGVYRDLLYAWCINQQHEIHAWPPAA